LGRASLRSCALIRFGGRAALWGVVAATMSPTTELKPDCTACPTSAVSASAAPPTEAMANVAEAIRILARTLTNYRTGIPIL
jgi:hypothetical protein